MTSWLLRTLSRVVARNLYRPVSADIALWRDAEFQVMRCELRYPPIRRLQHSARRPRR